MSTPPIPVIEDKSRLCDKGGLLPVKYKFTILPEIELE